MVWCLVNKTWLYILVATSQCFWYTFGPKRHNYISVIVLGTKLRIIVLEICSWKNLRVSTLTFMLIPIFLLWGYENYHFLSCLTSRMSYLIWVGGFPVIWVIKIPTICCNDHCVGVVNWFKHGNEVFSPFICLL